MRIYYWIGALGQTARNGGSIQRVLRSLAMALVERPGTALVAVRWCPEREAIVRADSRWIAMLARCGGPILPIPNEAHVPIHLATDDKHNLSGSWLLFPEILSFQPGESGVMPVAIDYARYYGLRTAAVVYDSIPAAAGSKSDAYNGFETALACLDCILPLFASAGKEMPPHWHARYLSAKSAPLIRPVSLGVELLATSAVDPGQTELGSAWANYADRLLSALGQAPEIPELAVVEGGSGNARKLGQALEASGVRVHWLRWDEPSQTILPGFHGGRNLGKVGRGDLSGLWAVVPVGCVLASATAMRIEDAARGLGLKVAFQLEDQAFVTEANAAMLSTVDLALFPSELARRAALAVGLRHLHKSATLRERIDVAEGAREVLLALWRRREPITSAPRPLSQERIYYWCTDAAERDQARAGARVMHRIRASLRQRGVNLVSLAWNNEGLCLTPLRSEADGQFRAPLSGRFDGEWFLLPESPLPNGHPAFRVMQLARSLGFRIACVYFGASSAKSKSVSSGDKVVEERSYLRAVAEADLVLAASWTIAGELHRRLADEGRPIPRIIPCPLGGDPLGVERRVRPRTQRDNSTPLRLLALNLSNLEPILPHLLRALALAKAHSSSFRVELTVLHDPGDRPEWQQKSDHPEIAVVTLPERAREEELAALFDAVDASVVRPEGENFGLSVLESIWRGVPCICHSGPGVAELSEGGGVFALDMLDVSTAASAFLHLWGDGAFLAKLTQQALSRSIRTWNDYGEDFLAALGSACAPPGWPLPAISAGSGRPLLTCAISTYNRAHWLRHSLPRLIEAAKPFGAAVQIVVCDNASPDGTRDVVDLHARAPGIKSVRNSENVGMLGNLGITARASDGSFVWLLGDDDLVLDGVIERALAGIERHPDVEMIYMNYAWSSVEPSNDELRLVDLLRASKPIGIGGPDRRVSTLREVAALNENLFTAIYACAFRRDHALRAYQIDVRGPPFSSLATCIPSSVYALRALLDRPAYWLGEPAVLVNFHVSWLRWALLWHLERMPELFNAAELAGIDPIRLDRHRVKHAHNAANWVREALFEAEEAIRTKISISRLIERCKHLEEFRRELPELYEVYADAYAAGRLSSADRLPARDLFAAFGLSSFTPMASAGAAGRAPRP